ncbi:MAG: hypothetical protein JRG96_07220 [Deltaproteobacteria bacterium]|nr:hypothetical protein [Deltaproteobacteria bacterium]
MDAGPTLAKISLRSAIALALAGVTGAAGLVYEVTWQKYFAILLGAQSEASAAVLALFLGGLSIGYALFGRLAHRTALRWGEGETPSRLLWLYGGCEIGVGLLAWMYPTLFRWLRVFSISLPGDPPALAFAFDVLLAACLILPPTVLMGATVPLLTQALARSLADSTRIHALVYGLNTLGAFAGALAGGFYLIPRFGLDGTLILLGIVNVTAGLVYLALGWRMPGWSESLAAPDDRTRTPRSLTAVAILFGFAMMSIQTVLLRLGGLAFGASHFTFALVVAIFVLCLAGGSLVVSRFPRIPAFMIVAVPWALVGWMIAIHPSFENLGYWAHVVRTLFRDSEASLYGFYAASAIGLFALLAVPIGLAGATLPLLFHFLRQEGLELGRVAGRLYAANTVGSVLGALLGGYLLLFWLNLDDVLRIAIAALAVGAAIATARVLPRSRLVWLALPAAAAIILLPGWEPERLTAGLFRERVPTSLTYAGPDAYFHAAENRRDIIYYADGPVASVAVSEEVHGHERDRAILVNGKSDGLLLGEYITMAMLGIVPALFADRVESAFVIGYGTGTTAGELGALDSIRSVDVVDISSEVFEAAPYFDYGNQRASENRKIRLRRGDAYRELLRSEVSYDRIASEPSNPCVTGTEMLFSREFLEAARSKLAPGGVYAQWVQAYEIDTPTFMLVLRTFLSVFDHVSVWYMQDTDLLLIGFDTQDQALDVDRLFARALQPDLAAAIGRAGVIDLAGLLSHEVLPVGVLDAAMGPGAIHTLSHPLLSHGAAKAFYRDDVPHVPRGLNLEAREVGARNSLLGRFLRRPESRPWESVWPGLIANACLGRPSQCSILFARWADFAPNSAARREALKKYRSDPRLAPGLRPDVLDSMQALFAGNSGEGGVVPYPRALATSELFARTYDHALPYPSNALDRLWSSCRDPKGGAGQCEKRRQLVARLLGRHP